MVVSGQALNLAKDTRTIWGNDLDNVRFDLAGRAIEIAPVERTRWASICMDAACPAREGGHGGFSTELVEVCDFNRPCWPVV